MPRSDSSVRPLVGLLLVLAHVGVAVAWQPVELRERAGGERRPHIEQLGGTDCPPPHDAARCLLCQSVTPRAVPTTATPALAPGTIVVGARETSSHALPPVRGWVHRSRAPPRSLT